ncbi:sporulation protein YqfD [Radiobacillus kanasensis]|uniref:sporulation protein YqfD n=1 Tax=Radiobacillus kanasensis TaxID=2844358 RepID=UPI001E53F9F8|nr:sporulation protein YqfD [Radiobacillus kanasensis]UFU01387.1 sporulation protein YqfD [Radiobacillus kanasensis]
MTQGSYFTGYVTMKITGSRPELFFALCAKENVPVWNVKKISNKVCLGNIHLKDVARVKKFRRKTVYKVSFLHKKGIPFLSQRILHKKPLVVGLVLSILFIGFLSNMVWDVRVSGVHPELEKKIMTQLDEYGVEPGTLKFRLGSPSSIQQKLLDDIPELLWVGVKEKGTTFYLEGVEKTLVEEKEEPGPRNLIAQKKGVIIDMFVSKGKPMVEVNDFVQKGELLVSGNINIQEEKEGEEDKKEEQKPDLVSSEGEIIAETWYQTSVSIPLEANYEVLTGHNKKKYYLNFAGFSLPVWGFGNPDYKNKQTETVEKSFHFLKWELPISFKQVNVQEAKEEQVKRSKKEAKEAGLAQARKELKSKLEKDAEIVSEKVLHETYESGKVKLILYFTVHENIVKNQPISQGD